MIEWCFKLGKRKSVHSNFGLRDKICIDLMVFWCFYLHVWTWILCCILESELYRIKYSTYCCLHMKKELFPHIFQKPENLLEVSDIQWVLYYVPIIKSQIKKAQILGNFIKKNIINLFTNRTSIQLTFHVFVEDWNRHTYSSGFVRRVSGRRYLHFSPPRCFPVQDSN